MSEAERIAERYSRRAIKPPSRGELLFNEFVIKERQSRYKMILDNHFKEPDKISVLEIGAGTGVNISFFKHIGIKPENIFANEMLNDRLTELKKNHPDIHVIGGNAVTILMDKKYDVVFQSTVFTSILDNAFRKQLAQKMMSLVTERGIILWYDFIFDNPRNKDVKKVTVNEIRQLFPSAQIKFYRVTLAPPIGRRVGKLYPLFNFFSFLRTHIIAEIAL